MGIRIENPRQPLVCAEAQTLRSFPSHAYARRVWVIVAIAYWRFRVLQFDAEQRSMAKNINFVWRRSGNFCLKTALRVHVCQYGKTIKCRKLVEAIEMTHSGDMAARLGGRDRAIDSASFRLNDFGGHYTMPSTDITQPSQRLPAEDDPQVPAIHRRSTPP
jgi:hypothetical protein